MALHVCDHASESLLWLCFLWYAVLIVGDQHVTCLTDRSPAPVIILELDHSRIELIDEHPDVIRVRSTPMVKHLVTVADGIDYGFPGEQAFQHLVLDV